ncbi:MAG TPA: glutamate-1-semialdehyde 2,1-aminomutase [Bacteroidales bacterium]|nr:MAG: Glutamate-1-semialdehyde 2,1-aminomutase [Bacteroidetes bacterium ADurb.Bin217]HPH16430.1 glutamate-1-semialdehyde 2,1-aminomutase [Bacteroidales bacterium]
MNSYSKSIEAFSRAIEVIPGGVNSPVRSCKSVGENPVFIASAHGAYINDIDGNSYIDYVGSWGPMILGHTHPKVIEALCNCAQQGTSFGAPTLWETQMAELICSMMPHIESVRMVNSGTEATMSALRLARGYTKRDKVIKFEGCYHGHHDSFLIQAGSGALTLSTPNSPGVTASTAKDTIVAQFNDFESVHNAFRLYGEDIAAIIVEPIPGNMGVVVPNRKFLQQLREICDIYEALLIFDEVMTGFRVAQGGAQELYDIVPDITTLGKIIGGGLPVGAYGGKKHLMDNLSPQGPIYQAGTLSGNPLAMTAGYTTLSTIKNNPHFYTELEEKSILLVEGIRENIKKTGVAAVCNRVGSMFTLFFTDSSEIKTYQDVCTCDTKKYAAFYSFSRDNGIYLAPSQFEAAFISIAHSTQDIERTIEANYNALMYLKNL